MWRKGSRQKYRKILSSAPPRDTTNRQLHTGSFPLKGTEKLDEQKLDVPSLPEGTAMRQMGETEIHRGQHFAGKRDLKGTKRFP